MKFSLSCIYGGVVIKLFFVFLNKKRKFVNFFGWMINVGDVGYKG